MIPTKEEFKEWLNSTAKDFEKDCRELGKERYPSCEIEPTFKNFLAWLDGRTWNMEDK